jgi:hypothetical protein
MDVLSATQKHFKNLHEEFNIVFSSLDLNGLEIHGSYLITLFMKQFQASTFWALCGSLRFLFHRCVLNTKLKVMNFRVQRI